LEEILMKVRKIVTALLALVLSAAVTQSLAGQTGGQSAASSSKTASNDGDLTQQLQSKFGQDPAFANVQISVTNATATVTGSVPAKADKKRAKEVAKSIPGVKHVKDQLTINPSAGKSTNSENNNKPADASINSGTNNSAATAASNSTNPSNGQTSATSNNLNSQASSTTGAANASSASAATSEAKENTSSAPQNTGNAANENNMAGQGSPSSSTSAPATTQSATGSNAIGANVGGASSASPSSSSEAGISINDTATLQSQIQNALQNEPTLRNDSVNVTVTDSTIELSGNVQNGKEKETARRIASSFAGNRRVKDRVTLSGKGAASTSPNSSSLSGNPASTVVNQTPNRNPNAQNPSANNPAANGDASANPR
jgi:osmotically-inducible protein OsmY